MWKLVIEDDEGKRTIVPLTRDEYSIGRKEGNTIRLTERNVSREHARVARHIDESGKSVYAIEDLTSYNGVFVNGLRVAHAQDLVHGDLIQIGDYRVVLQDDALTEGAPATAQGSRSSISDGGGRASQLMEKPNRLVMLAGPTPGAEFALDTDRITIGRADDAGIAVNHNSVSRLHCEVHALGDGRFEIVDKGSANGVRVNGADLRRGIIEAGDVIELGDVRFRFVGAGQIFLPGATDSQRLAAITDRTAASILATRRSSNALPITIFLTVVSIGAVVVWFATRPSTDSVAAANAPIAVSSPAQTAVDEAKQLAQAGDLDGAHQKLAGLPEGAKLRDGEDVRDIEARWADSLLAKSQAEPDSAKRKELLDRVATAPQVDSARRKQAVEALSAGEAPSQRVPEAAPAAPKASGAPATGASSEAPKRQPAAPGTDATPVIAAAALPVVPPPPRPAPAESDIEKERALVLQGEASKRLVKQQLEAKMSAGRASEEELRLLKSVCRDLGDRACVDQTKLVLQKRAPQL